jgi:hypothetical protein
MPNVWILSVAIWFLGRRCWPIISLALPVSSLANVATSYSEMYISQQLYASPAMPSTVNSTSIAFAAKRLARPPQRPMDDGVAAFHQPPCRVGVAQLAADPFDAVGLFVETAQVAIGSMPAAEVMTVRRQPLNDILSKNPVAPVTAIFMI